MQHCRHVLVLSLKHPFIPFLLICLILKFLPLRYNRYTADIKHEMLEFSNKTKNKPQMVCLKMNVFVHSVSLYSSFYVPSFPQNFTLSGKATSMKSIIGERSTKPPLHFSPKELAYICITLSLLVCLSCPWKLGLGLSYSLFFSIEW